VSGCGSGEPWLRTGMGHSTPTTISVCGMDLANDLMGEVSFSALAFRFVGGRFPTPAELQLFDAVLVSLADHGMTPSVLAARLTYTGAPEALQASVAAGLLGGGSVFLGVAEDTARFLAEILDAVGPLDEALSDAALSDEALREAAAAAITARRAGGQRTPGLGHPVHKDVDPRVPRLYALADQLGLEGAHLRLLRIVAEEQARLDRVLPVNGAGSAGAALADLGFGWRIIRGFALLARTAGLLGHLAEEMDEPLGLPLWKAVDQAVTQHEQADEQTRDQAHDDGALPPP
jgi:citrate synthase